MSDTDPRTAERARAEPHHVHAAAPSSASWLMGGGEMGALIRTMDWSPTPLGPIESWPQSLRTAASLCLASNFPICLAWGPEHVQLYNDGYRVVCGSAHPRTMGQPFHEAWASAWPKVGEPFERALAGGTEFLENVRMFLERNGYMEETFFTFSFSPIRDESGGVGGLFHPVTETTAAMLAQRRTRTLRDLAARTGEARSPEAAYGAALAVLGAAELDLPFVLLYDVIDDAHMQLVGSAGLPAGTSASPLHVETNDATAPWSLGGIVGYGQITELRDTTAELRDLPHGPYAEPPNVAFSIPLSPGGHRVIGAMVVGASPRLPLDESYRAFLNQCAAAVASAVAEARAYEEERRRSEALAALDHAKTTFFSNVSHELRTPLTLILGPLEDLLHRRHGVTAEVRAELDLVHRNALRLLKLVNTLLDFSRLEAGRAEGTYKPVDVSAYTAELASAFRSAADRAGLALVVDTPSLPAGESVYVDRDMWEKIVLNLLSNAFKHTFEGEIRVIVRCAPDDDSRVELEVCDTGVGIAADEVPKLFERFHRVTSTRARAHEGSGIGLALVRELVRLHGGDVRAASRLGRGTTFTVSLPRGASHLPADRVGTARLPDTPSVGAEQFVTEMLRWLPEDEAGQDGTAVSDEVPKELAADVGAERTVPVERRARILLADDNADMREYVARLLRGVGWAVEVVGDGSAALEVARARRPDLVLSDVMMPGLDGFALLRELRADASTRTVPIILLSARAGEESRVEGLEAGADDYLIKPFAARELLARVRANLELARMRSDVARAEEGKRATTQFLQTMSHELRTPLNAALGYVELLELGLHGPVTGAQLEILQRIRRSQRHLLGLVAQVLSLSRLEAGQMLFELRDVTVGALVTAVLEMIEPQARAKGMRLAPPVSTDCVVHVDLDKTQQVLLNLLTNAVKFAPSGAEITIRCDSACGEGGDTQVAISVHDTGRGIPPDQLEHIFTPFVQLDGSLTRTAEGVGLGLAISRDLARGMGGDLTVESTVGVGSSFTLRLPAA